MNRGEVIFAMWGNSVTVRVSFLRSSPSPWLFPSRGLSTFLASGEVFWAILFPCGHLHFCGSSSVLLGTSHTWQVPQKFSLSPSGSSPNHGALLGTCYSESATSSRSQLVNLRPQLGVRLPGTQFPLRSFADFQSSAAFSASRGFLAAPGTEVGEWCVSRN